MEYHILYVKSRKSFEVRREKNYYFVVCQKNYMVILLLCRVSCVIFLLCGHMAKKFFAVCSIEFTQQATGHTAKSQILIVMIVIDPNGLGIS